MSSAAQVAILPDHILSAILTVAHRQEQVDRFAFRGHDYVLQRIFHELRRNPQYSLLRGFVFSDSGPVPYSPILSDAVSKLQLSGLLGRENPDYEIIFLTPAADKFFDDVLRQRFSQEDLAQIERIASEFRASVTGPR